MECWLRGEKDWLVKLIRAVDREGINDAEYVTRHREVGPGHYKLGLDHVQVRRMPAVG